MLKDGKVWYFCRWFEEVGKNAFSARQYYKKWGS